MSLILIKYSPDHPAEGAKLSSAKEADCAVLIQNGVYWAACDALKDAKCPVYAIKDDFLARGYEEGQFDIELIDYDALVELIERNEGFVG